MNIQTAFPSRFLRAADFDEDRTVTIREVKTEIVGQGKDAEEKPVVYFTEVEQGLALNKTNSEAIASLYGYETDEWVGKRITLFSTEVDFGGKPTLAIRVRLRKPAGAAKPAASVPVAAGQPQPLAKAKMAARNAFDAKWIDHEIENPDDAGMKDARWKSAQLEFAKVAQKTIGDLTVEDWTKMAQDITDDFHCGTGNYVGF